MIAQELVFTPFSTPRIKFHLIRTHFRALIAGHEGPGAKDLKALLQHFYGRHPNWQILPYLTENLARIDSKEVFETVLATEKLEDSDKEEFRNSGRLKQRSSDAELMKLVHKRLDGFPQRLTKPESKWLLETWDSIYILLLYAAVLEARWPGKKRAEKKVKAFIKFMMEEIKCMFLNVFGITFGWFSGHPGTRLLDPLRSRKLFTKLGNVNRAKVLHQKSIAVTI